MQRTVGELGAQTAGEPRLRAVHAAVEGLRNCAQRTMGAGEPGRSAPMVMAARQVATEVAEVERRGLLAPEALQNLVGRVEELASLLEFEPRVELPPLFLDVAAPEHGEVTVSEGWTHFGPKHVTTNDSDVVVQANECHLDAVDHYHVRRVTLDCASLYEDPAVVDGFAQVMTDPSGRNIGALKALLRGRVGPPRPDGVQAYRKETSPFVSVDSHRSKVVNQGDQAEMRVNTHYHVRETVIPVAEMLNERPELIADLAAAFRHEPGAADPAAKMLTAVGDLDTRDLLHGAKGLADGGTSVKHSFGGAKVDFASAVMVGYGNTMTRRSEISLSSRVGGTVKKLDKALARAQAAAQPVMI